MTHQTIQPQDELHLRLKRLGLYGLLSCWPEIAQQSWVAELVEIEERERQRRSLEYRLQAAHIGPFKPMADFDWAWPSQIDRELIEELFSFQFLHEASNVILLGPGWHRQEHDRPEFGAPGAACVAYRALHHCQRDAQ